MSLHEQVPVTAGPPPRIEIHDAAGSVTVQAAEGAEHLAVWVDPLDGAAEESLDRVEIDLRVGGAVSPARRRVSVPERRLLHTPAFAVRVSTPPGAATRIVVASADVRLTGALGELEITTASGDIDVERCTGAWVRTASGGAHIATVTGHGSIGTASGDIRIGRGLDLLKLHSASGDITVEHAGGDTTAKTASGDVTVGAAAGHHVQAQTASGDISVGVPPGRRVWLDLHNTSGRMSSDLEDEGPGADGTADLTLNLDSMSGRIRVGHTTPVG
jgi:DUF4097 and DUF4098 domain-containing protein YvlB